MYLFCIVLATFSLTEPEVVDTQSVDIISTDKWRTAISMVFDNAQTFSNGRYKGETNNRKREGLGTYSWDGGASYWGNWNRGNRRGVGIYICPKDVQYEDPPDCIFYVGEWNEGKRHGRGRGYDTQGNLIYYGNFLQDNVADSVDLDEYEQFKFSCIEYPSGHIYVGETKNSQRQGLGVFIWIDGDAWFGYWKDDKQAGEGIYFHYEGTVQKGHWNDGQWVTNRKKR